MKLRSTYDASERGIVGLRKEDHGVDDLYARVCVDIDAVCLVVQERL